MLTDWLTDVEVQTAPVPPALGGVRASGVLWQAATGRFLLEVPGVARYLVTDGRLVTIEPMRQAEAVDLMRFLRMGPLAALLFQRGMLAFHAAAIANEQGALLIAGDSGAGKSTLLTALLQRGWGLLADDLAVVDLDADGQPMVLPTFPEIVLWREAMERLQISETPEVCTRRVLSMQTQLISRRQPLRAIYWLSVNHKDELETSGITGIERFKALIALSYNRRIADALLDRTTFLRKAGIIARSVPLRHLRRPHSKWSVKELVEVIHNG